MDLLLFDIDGTLVGGMPPTHRQAICDGLREVYRVEARPETLGPTAGMTDTAITLRALRAVGLPEAACVEGLPAFYRAAGDAYARRVEGDLRACVLPHVGEALEWLRERGHALGLVTGNIAAIAWCKLGAAGLGGYFGCGAFGDEAEAREQLPPLALDRAREVFGRVFTPAQAYVVGDTPADIACGAACAMRTVGVATGSFHTLEQLRECRPDYLMADLRGLRELPL